MQPAQLFTAAAIFAAAAAAPQNVLWLPLGDSITHGCTGPTIQDCHDTSAGYRIPLALALSQAALGAASNEGFNVSTMGTASTGPAYVPAQWLRHCGFPGWTSACLRRARCACIARNILRLTTIS